MKRLHCLAALVLLLCACSLPRPRSYDAEEKSILQLQADMAAGRTSAEQLVLFYLARIDRIDRAGPHLNSVLALNPEALKEARALDEERREGRVRGPLHGVPILVKDNIETADMATTAGSLALAGNFTHRDAPLVARLRAAGAIILGKTNLSEWANIRSSASISGWSAVGGLTRNPYALDRNACGSSSGSGAAAAASLAAGAIGTETDGSITCPSSVNGLVGIKPTLGLVSRSLVVPISHSQDTPGPIGRSVADVAILLDAIAGEDPADPATVGARRVGHQAALDATALQGARVGVLRFQAGFSAPVDARFEAALKQLRAAGATLVEIAQPPPGLDMNALGDDELVVLLTELRADLNAYLAKTPPEVQTRTLAQLIAFNAATPAETILFGQDLFEQAEATKGLSDPSYMQALKRARTAAARALDHMLREHRVDVLIAPTAGPAWTTDLVNGDHFTGGAAGSLPAIAGYPHLTVPMGQVAGLPVGLSMIGPAWSDAKLLSYAFAYEQASRARVPPTYPRSLSDAAPFAAAMEKAEIPPSK